MSIFVHWIIHIKISALTFLPFCFLQYILPNAEYLSFPASWDNAVCVPSSLQVWKISSCCQNSGASGWEIWAHCSFLQCHNRPRHNLDRERSTKGLRCKSADPFCSSLVELLFPLGCHSLRSCNCSWCLRRSRSRRYRKAKGWSGRQALRESTARSTELHCIEQWYWRCQMPSHLQFMVLLMRVQVGLLLTLMPHHPWRGGGWAGMRWLRGCSRTMSLGKWWSEKLLPAVLDVKMSPLSFSFCYFTIC